LQCLLLENSIVEFENFTGKMFWVQNALGTKVTNVPARGTFDWYNVPSTFSNAQTD